MFLSVLVPGRTALEAVMKAIMKYETPLVPPPGDYAGDFFQDVASALVGVGLIVNNEAAPGMLALDKVTAPFTSMLTGDHQYRGEELCEV